MEGILHHAEAEAQMSKAGLLEQLNWHRQQLSRAQEEIRRLRPAEAHFTAVTSEVEYLRPELALSHLPQSFQRMTLLNVKCCTLLLHICLCLEYFPVSDRMNESGRFH